MSAGGSADLAQVVADVLGKHSHPGEMSYVFEEAWFYCGCGERFGVRVVDGMAKVNEANEAWRLHVGMAAGDAIVLATPPGSGSPS